MADGELTPLQQKIAEEKARRLAASSQHTVTETSNLEDRYAHLAPEADFEPDPFDDLLKSVNILDAYRMWCGKMTPSVRPGQTESIMVSCPTPGHRDSNPSAWLNTSLNTWYCGACQTGGDAYDIAANHFGIADYRSGEKFGKLRRLMAESLGYSVTKIGKKDVPYLRAVPDPEPEPEVAPTQLTEAPPVNPLLPTIVEPPPVQTEEEILAEVIELDDQQIIFPTLDWRSIVTPGTFLDDYMQACVIDDIAEEYHFWNGLIGLGLAAGRDAYLLDSPYVYANLFVCLLGLTGDGKSRSLRHLKRVLKDALPYNSEEDYPKGVYNMPTPSSAESMIAMFTSPVLDPVNPKNVIDYAPIRGFVEFAELAELALKAGRAGSTLKPTLIEFYDMKDSVGTTSVTNGTKFASEPFCSVFSSTQPSSLKDILQRTDTGSGFLNRWVFASGKPKERNFFQKDIVDVSAASESLKRIHGWIGLGKRITVSPEAIEIMETFHKSILERLIQQNDSGLINRLPLLYKKLLLLLAINEKTSEVSADIANKVVSMHNYQYETFELPAQNIGRSLTDEVYQELSRHLQRKTTKTDGCTLGYLKQCIRNKHYPIEVINKVLKIMEQLGEVEVTAVQPLGGRGRPSTKYRWIAS